MSLTGAVAIDQLDLGEQLACVIVRAAANVV
jgi:hypothetical protein